MSRVKRRTTTSFDALLEEITGAAQLAAQSDKCGARADSVSHWSVRQQLDHADNNSYSRLREEFSQADVDRLMRLFNGQLFSLPLGERGISAEGDDWVSMAVPSDGSYGIEPGVIYSYPCRCSQGKYEIVQGLDIGNFSRERMDATEVELREERAAIEELL